MIRHACLFSACVAFLGALPVHATNGLLAYEGFNYGTQINLDGLNGGVGWTSPWVDTAQGLFTRVESTGLDYSGLPASPGAAATQDWNSYDWTIYERSFTAAPGDTLYISFLYRPDAAGYGTYGGLSIGGYPNEVWVGSPLGYYTYGLRYGRYGFSFSNIPEVPGMTVFLVLEVKLLPATSQTHFSLYVNPTPGSPKPAFPDAEGVLSGGFALPTGLRIDNDGGVTTDEIRVSTTWEAAAPGPCPGDVNGDMQADLVDLSILLSHYGMNGGATWADGDLSHDGRVDLADLAIMLSYYGAPCQ